MMAEILDVLSSILIELWDLKASVESIQIKLVQITATQLEFKPIPIILKPSSK